MKHSIHLDLFEGPFDLLLYLIQKDELNIYDIPIADITQQFIDYLDKNEQINLEYAGDFIDMVATLIKIKSIMLLPKAKQDESDLIDDPRTPLVQRLIEYKQFKEAAHDLKILEDKYEWIKSRSYFKYLQEYHKEFAEENSTKLIDLSLYDLIKAFKKVMDELPKITEHHVRQISVSIEEQSSKILNYLRTEKILFFSKLINDTEEKIVTVVTFISLLELTKAQAINLEQEILFADILIKKHELEKLEI
jgi:segregation and condensation protein A